MTPGQQVILDVVYAVLGGVVGWLLVWSGWNKLNEGRCVMTQQIDDGGPAFPQVGNCEDRRGMSLRDWFAGQAMECSSTKFAVCPEECAKAAERAYQIADAMLVERSKVRSDKPVEIESRDEVEQKTAEEWCSFFNAVVLDADGWRRVKKDFDSDEKMTASEFAERWYHSTCRQPPSPKLRFYVKRYEATI